jgi:hypothetical protein
MNNSAGRQANRKRSVANSSGGRCASASLMTTKLVPQIAAAASAMSASRGGRPAPFRTSAA